MKPSTREGPLKFTHISQMMLIIISDANQTIINKICFPSS